MGRETSQDAAREIRLKGGSNAPMCWVRITGILFLGFGLALRVAYYAGAPALSNDEVLVAINVRTRDVLGLLGTLDFGQSIPVVHVLAAKLAVAVLGDHGMAYRLPSFLGGAALLLLVWRSFPELIGATTATVLLGFLAVYVPLIEYSATLKPYGVDAAVTAALLAAALRFRRSPRSARDWRTLGLWGIAGLVVSQPAVFVVAGLGVALLVDTIMRGKDGFGRLVLVGAVWVAVFLALYGAFYRRAVGDSYMQRFWESSFLIPGADWIGRVREALWTLPGLGHFPQLRLILVGILLAIGFLGIWRRVGLPGALMLVLPFAALVGASGLRLYPISNRLVLFTAPLLLWGLGASVTFLAGGLERKVPRLVAGAALFLALWTWPAAAAVRLAAHPPDVEPVPDLVATVRDTDRGAPAIVIFGGYFSWAFHAGNWQDRELLLANTRLFYRCVTERPVPAGCDELTFRGHLLAEPVLATGYPPDQVDIVTDHRWIAAHAARLLERPERRFWVVAATYPEAFRERRIMQRFLGALRTAGAQVRLATRSGSSLLYRVTLP